MLPMHHILPILRKLRSPRKYVTALLLLDILICTLLPAVSALADPAQVWRSGDESVPRIAITVDDCYRKDDLIAILDLCDVYDVRVTFFPVGNAIKPEDGALWRRVVESGHEIGNHSNTHTSMSNLPAQKIYYQLTKMEAALDAALGYAYNVRCFRPPYGAAGKLPYRRLLDKYGYPDLILWSVSQIDPELAFDAVKNGSILLYHTKSKDVECLTSLIPRLLEADYELVTVSQLLHLEPIEKTR